MRIIITVLLLTLLFTCKSKKTKEKSGSPKSTTETTSKVDLNKSIQTIAFGSCNKQDKPQDIWPFIQQNNPELWVWLGDNIYGDTEDMAVMSRKYASVKNNAAYQNFQKKTTIIGTWDDHDYGVNDGGKGFAKKEGSKKCLLDFLEVPQNAAVRNRPGIYDAYTFGPADKKVKVILLDERWFRDDLQKATDGKRRYVPNETGDILGEAQWKWLETELNDKTVQLNIIAGGIQVIPKEHGYEKWANFPAARKRLFDLFQKINPPNVMLLSGDRHIAEISKIELEGMDDPLYEITSSGLTHSWTRVGTEPNQYREGDLIIARNFGIMHLNWKKQQQLDVLVQIKGVGNKLLLEKNISFD